MRKKVVIIGGGTGTYTVLNGLKDYDVKLSAIVSMMDSGGSNRILRDEFGLLPTSDLRQCIVALASRDKNGLIRELFTYRYHQGIGIEGMTFGNLFMAALTDIYGSQEKAIKKTCEFLNVQGDIIPVTYDNSHLVARYENGAQVLGEHYIDEPDERNGRSKIVELSVIPPAIANDKALDAIKNADLIILGPGDLYTSTLCNLVVDGVQGEIEKSKAKVIYIVNLMTKYGQTNGFKASDHVEEIEKYLGEGAIDSVFVNKEFKIPKSIKNRYEEEHAEVVKDDLKSVFKGKKIVRKDFRASGVVNKSKGDKLVRSLIRHDSERLAKALINEF